MLKALRAGLQNYVDTLEEEEIINGNEIELTNYEFGIVFRRI